MPEWARAGFSGDGSGFPHVLGQRGDLMAVLFGHPLTTPEAEKILWISRPEQAPGQPLRIDATRAGTATTVRREVPGGPGPSAVALPSPGCWELTLTWSGHTDRMALQFG